MVYAHDRASGRFEDFLSQSTTMADGGNQGVMILVVKRSDTAGLVSLTLAEKYMMTNEATAAL